MSMYSQIRERVIALLERSREEKELAEELRFHLEMETEANERAGMSREEAARQARIAFGGVEKHREEVREARGFGWLEIVARDVGYALRGVAQHPVFATTLIVTLALGIGTAVAMFAIVDALLLRPLPYHEPGRLVGVERELSPSGMTVPVTSWEDARFWREESGLLPMQ